IALNKDQAQTPISVRENGEKLIQGKKYQEAIDLLDNINYAHEIQMTAMYAHLSLDNPQYTRALELYLLNPVKHQKIKWFTEAQSILLKDQTSRKAILQATIDHQMDLSYDMIYYLATAHLANGDFRELAQCTVGMLNGIHRYQSNKTRILNIWHLMSNMLSRNWYVGGSKNKPRHTKHRDFAFSHKEFKKDWSDKDLWFIYYYLREHQNHQETLGKTSNKYKIMLNYIHGLHLYYSDRETKGKELLNSVITDLQGLAIWSIHHAGMQESANSILNDSIKPNPAYPKWENGLPPMEKNLIFNPAHKKKIDKKTTIEDKDISDF
ncbi:MAG: hypothetical protein HRU15_11755, partial [Planctomycetes bacterium]|nr:hypothetical protein [Planctomycetota bacterium]